MKWRRLPQQTRTPPAAAPDSLLLDTPNAAALLGVSPSTLLRLSAAGKVARLKVRSRVVFARSDLCRYADSLLAAAAQTPTDEPSCQRRQNDPTATDVACPQPEQTNGQRRK